MNHTSKFSRLAIGAGLVALLATAACESGDTESVAPVAELDTTGAQGTVWSANAQGWWSATAQVPDVPSTFVGEGGYTYFNFRGSAVFDGPAGATRRMGVCLLAHMGGVGGIACSTAADCGTPSGGNFYYCADPYSTGNKQCYVRPGSQTAYCGGSPALPGNAPIAPATIYTPQFTASYGNYWVSYACFEGCATTDPSTSSIGYIYGPQYLGDPCGGNWCGDVCC
jgi:hypothetical protein